MPRNNIKDRVIHLTSEKLTSKFVYDSERLVNILIPSNRSLKISRICHSISSNRTKIRNNKMTLINLYKPSSCISFTLNCKLDSSLHNCNFFRLNFHYTIFCFDPHISFLRNKQHVTIRVIKSFILH